MKARADGFTVRTVEYDTAAVDGADLWLATCAAAGPGPAGNLRRCWSTFRRQAGFMTSA